MKRYIRSHWVRHFFTGSLEQDGFPRRCRPILQQEGIVLLDEGIGGTVIFRNFRAPGKRYGYRRNWFTGSLVLTGLRFAGFQFSKPIINVPLEDRWLNELDCSLRDETTLLR